MPSLPPILFHQQSQEGAVEADVAANHCVWKTTSVISIGCHILHFLFSIVTQGSVSVETGLHFSVKDATLYPLTIICRADRKNPGATHAMLILLVPLKRTGYNQLFISLPSWSFFFFFPV